MSSKLKKSTKIDTGISATEESLPEQSEKAGWSLMIAEAAYCRAEQMGFTSDQEIEDWLETEKQIEEMLSAA